MASSEASVEKLGKAIVIILDLLCTMILLAMFLGGVFRI